ncbi:GMC family oxidoreductase [bacterium]|nr:MAG: GMC family oxidoreductase [bacterium]
MESHDAVVIGSGPAGAVAARALLDAGAKVLMLDVGRTLEPERAAAAARLAAREPEQWAPGEAAALAGEARTDAKRPKLVFGSDYAYAGPREARVVQDGTNVLVSHARGGLSTVWGAALAPNPAAEFDGWPFGREALEPHYDAVAALVGATTQARPSDRARRLLSRHKESAAALAGRGFTSEPARLALDLERCRNVGLCLTGCPYGAVWSSERLLDSLKSRPGFAYEAGVRVRRLKDGAVEAEGRSFRAPKVYLAAGALASARIAAESLGLYDKPLPMLYQPYFLAPFLATGGGGDPEAERLHTLAQVFLGLSDPAVSKRRVHLQLYTYSAHIRTAVDDALGPLGRLVPGARRALLSRLCAVQGYLHSEEGGTLWMTLRAAADGGPAEVRLTAPPAGKRKAAVQRVLRALLAARRELGGVVLSPLARHGLPGDGSHVGGTFPMAARPVGPQTDALGRLAGLPGVHLVDGACLPSIPATTFTFTVMANARRIAAESVR